MKKFLKGLSIGTIVAVLTVLGISAFTLAAPAAAAGNASASTAALTHGGGGRYGEAALTAAAEMLNLSVDELRTQLRAGESLADLAEEAGVDVDALLAAMDAAAAAAARAAIEQAVTDGDLTREHADWLLEGLDAGYWGPGASSPGIGFGLHGPRGGFDRPADLAASGADA